MTVTRSEKANVQAIRSVCDRVGVGSLKEKQIEAIVLHQDTFIYACHAEDYCPQYCGYGYYCPLLFRCRQWLAQATAVVDISVLGLLDSFFAFPPPTNYLTDKERVWAISMVWG